MAESQQAHQMIATDTVETLWEVVKYMRQKHIEFPTMVDQAEMKIYVEHEDTVTMKPLFAELKEQFPERVFWL